ncbi:MAG: imidazole glycerol phosphate synthase subunit HisH [Flammeovirgaceae bacterium]|nr:imidazole glycerol phosphate synthase subunit HisH [Flammeovirgaceae bacterium]|tara:strand:- start:330 stop:947 length:618 start_codon:yes stop_codon:yes gene_type:complete
MTAVTIIDYGMCNLDSVARAVEECGGNPTVTDKHSVIESADSIILPGVGAFPDAMKNIQERGLEDVLRKRVVDDGVPFLGICLGMQLLASKGYEVSECKGLGWIEGEIVKLEPKGEDTRIPHIGWDEVHYPKPSKLFEGIPEGKDFYFVHSFHFVPKNEEAIIGYTKYADGGVSALQKGNIHAVQFHPEKSQKVGFALLRNFLSL